MAQSAGDAAAAQLVACECVVSAELKDHLNWELLGRCGEHLRGEQAKLLSDASERFSAQEGEHLYRTKSRCRDLWIQSLGILQAVPPPLEEKRYLELAIGIARAEQATEDTRERRRSAH
jgi:hypothetical protein